MVKIYLYLSIQVEFDLTVVPAKSDSDIMFCL